jgi:hypothetical protein
MGAHRKRGVFNRSRQHRPEPHADWPRLKPLITRGAIRRIKTRQISKSQLFQFLFRFETELISDRTPGLG